MRHPSIFIHNSNEYRLHHLQPSRHTLLLEAHNKHPELKLTLDVRFSNHCYSEGKPKAGGLTHDFTDNKGQHRWFCPERHKTSLLLPNLIKQLPSKKCLFTGRYNWLIVELHGDSGNITPFHVYFTLKKHRFEDKGLFLYIESAYKKVRGGNSPSRKKRTDRVAFYTLARKTLSGEPVRRQKKKPPIKGA